MSETALPIPDWVDNPAKEIRGLDLLGLRQPAQTLGLVVLSGIATVTPTVRYFSIRAWIIKAFGESGSKATSDAIAEYAAKIEAAVVLGNLLADPNRGGFVGSDQARDRIESGDDPLSLDRLVRSQIAFNIYAGSSDGLCITKTEDSGLSALIAERGLPLANQIESVLAGTEFGKLLAGSELPNQLPRTVLQELGEKLAINVIPERERELLVDALMPKEPQIRGGSDEAMRVATFTALLELAQRLKRPPRDADLFGLAIEANPPVPETLNGVLDGWARYVIRDMLAVVHEAAMNAVTQELAAQHEDGAFVDAPALVSELVSRAGPINDALRGLGFLSNDETYDRLDIAMLSQRLDDATNDELRRDGIRRWRNELTEERVVQAARTSSTGAIGLLPVAWLLARRRIDLMDDRSQDVVAQMSRQGHSRLGVAQMILPSISRWINGKAALADVVAELVHLTVEQHLRVAWSRLATDVKKDVALLIADGDRWYFRKPFGNGRLASRLRQAIGWLQQLELIDDGGITEAGKTVLQRGKSTLETVQGASP